MSNRPVGPPDVLARAMSAEIRAELGRLNMSGRTLAELIEKSPPYVHDRLNDQKTFNVNDIDIIASALGLEVETLIQRALRTREDYRLAAQHGSIETGETE